MKRNFHDDERPSNQEAIEGTAAAWLAEKDHGLTPAQAADFERWCQADPRHAQAFARLEGAWGALQALRDFRPASERHPDPNLLRPASPTRRIIPFPKLLATGMAAALALTTAWWVWESKHSSLPAVAHYATTVDGFERVALEDGSVVELNGSSEIRVQITADERRGQLLRGEALFTVAKNRGRPFRVTAGSVAVQAIGTAFNVRLGASDVEVLVTEGKVALDSSGGTGAAAAATRNNSSGEIAIPTLSANERAVVLLAPPATTTAAPATPASIIRSVSPEEIREALAWQSPRLVFVDTPLADAIAQFNRRNRVQVELADADLGTLPIGGSFRADNVDAFLRLLETGGDVRVQRTDATRIILHRAK